MKFFALLLLLVSPSLAVADSIVFCKPGDATVPNRVERYIRSADTPKFRLSDVILSPDLSLVRDLPRVFWKCNGTNIVQPMTPEEIASLRAVLTAGGDTIECNPTTRRTVRVNVAPAGAGGDKLEACMRNAEGVLKWQSAKLATD